MSQQIIARVRQAIEFSVKSGSRLRTPDSRKVSCFLVESVGGNGVKVDKLGQTPITWEELGHVVCWLRSRGCNRGESGYTCAIGSTQGSNATEDTLEWCLREFTGRTIMKSSYVAPILAEASIVTVDGKRPNKVTITEAWR